MSLLTAVADPVRWTVLQRLAQAPSCVCDLQEHVPIAPNLLSYHLKVLREAGLVTTSRRGRWIDYALAEDALDRLPPRCPAPDGARPADERRRAPARHQRGRSAGARGRGGAVGRGVLGQRPAVGPGVLRRARHGARGPADRDAALLLLRHVKIAPAAVRDHLRDHHPALLHEHRTHPGAARRAPRRRRQRDGRRARRGHPVLLVQRGPGVHRLRRRRRPARA